MDQALSPSCGVSLRATLANARLFGARDIRATSCCGIPALCQPGDVFVALVHPDGDGHDAIDEAVQNGATAVLAERYVPSKVPVCVVEDSREAYGQLCQSLVGRPSDSLNTIGITGTCGKTSTAMLVRCVLLAADRQAGISCTIENNDTIESAAGIGAAASSPQLATWLGRMTAAGCTDGVVELSSQTLAQRCHAGIEFDMAVLTNLTRDHLDFHGSVKNYRNAKARLFASLKPGGIAILNADDPASQTLGSNLGRPALTFSRRSAADVFATVLERHRSEQTFLLSAGHESIPVRTQTIGDGHISNCLAAAAVGLALDIDLPTIARGLESVQYVAGRLERLECGQPFSVYVDACRTPNTFASTLKTVRQVTSGRVFCVFGADASLDPDMRPLLGRVAERGGHESVITNHNPRNEQPLAIVHDILDGYQRPGRARIMPDRRKAIEWALRNARTGDSVLIAGKGDENYQLIGSVPHLFDDRIVARNWLYEVGASTELPTEFQPKLRVVRHIA